MAKFVILLAVLAISTQVMAKPPSKNWWSKFEIKITSAIRKIEKAVKKAAKHHAAEELETSETSSANEVTLTGTSDFSSAGSGSESEKNTASDNVSDSNVDTNSAKISDSAKSSSFDTFSDHSAASQTENQSGTSSQTNSETSLNSNSQSQIQSQSQHN